MTKRALAAAFKDLVCQYSFEKVNVSDICDACGVSRKTFYYHFQDKYELAEWIFNTEFIAVLKETDTSDQWAFAAAICQYFFKERTYLCRAFAVQGPKFLPAVLSGVLVPIAGAISPSQGCGTDGGGRTGVYAGGRDKVILSPVFHRCGAHLHLPLDL